MRLSNTLPELRRLPRQVDPVEVLKETSRTFYFSIIDLPPGLRDAVMSAYLSLRAIDEIEDHPRLDKMAKIRLLREISFNCQFLDTNGVNRLFSVISPYREHLPEVTNRLGEWLTLPPESIAPRICNATSVMARRMAYWVRNNWQIHTKNDLDCYTFSVAGAVGLLLSELWVWHDGTVSHRKYAIGFGRGLQAVNILRNRSEDLARGADFFPDGWNEDNLQCFAKTNLTLAEAYFNTLPPGPAKDFCRLPLSLAYATLDALARGEPKVSRLTVMEIVGVEEGHSGRKMPH